MHRVKKVKHAEFTQKSAEVLALQGVTFLASDDARISRFMATTGMSAESLTRNVANASVLAGVLDYILTDEALLLEFAEFAGIAPDMPALARLALPGFVHH